MVLKYKFIGSRKNMQSFSFIYGYYRISNYITDNRGTVSTSGRTCCYSAYDLIPYICGNDSEKEHSIYWEWIF